MSSKPSLPQSLQSVQLAPTGNSTGPPPGRFLSPRIVEAIVEDRQPPELTIIGLTRRIEFALLWSIQERALGLAYSTRPGLSNAAEEPEGTTEIAPG